MLYLGEDQMTCLHEAQALGWPAMSTAIVPVQFDLRAIVDLRDPSVQSALHTNSGELAFNFRSLQPRSAPTQIWENDVPHLDGSMVYYMNLRPWRGK